MYFFDLEDYATTFRAVDNAAAKDAAINGANAFVDGGLYGCTRNSLVSDWGDYWAVARETRNAFFTAVCDYYSASTICSTSSICNSEAHNIFYNEFIPNFIKSFSATSVYHNSTQRPYRGYERVIRPATYNPTPFVGTYTDYVNVYIGTGEIFSGTVVGSITVPASTGGFSSHTLSINYGNGQLTDNIYYTHDTCLRNVMGSLKRLCKALDDDDFEDI